MLTHLPMFSHPNPKKVVYIFLIIMEYIYFFLGADYWWWRRRNITVMNANVLNFQIKR